MSRRSASTRTSAAPVRAARAPDEIYERLKAMAMTFAIRPGERVNEVELARALSVSRTPLREALNRLLVEGFLTRAPNRGFTGRLLDAKQIFDLYEFRRTLETAIVRLACERATDEEIRELEQFVRTSVAQPDDGHAPDLLDFDERFHVRVAELTRNHEMVRALTAVNARIHYVRWIDMQKGHRGYTQQEHVKIVKALKSRDAEKAAALVEDHIERRLDQIVDVIRTGMAEIYMRDRSAGHAQGAG